MSDALRTLLSDARLPSEDPVHSELIEAAREAGLVTDTEGLRAFLRARLLTVGTIEAYVAAAVCARAQGPQVPDSLWRGVEVELEARIPSPAARLASRREGGRIFGMATRLAWSPILDALGRATVASLQRPHHAVTLGAIGAVAGLPPEEAARAAAYAAVAGPALAAHELLGIDTKQIAKIGAEMNPDVRRLAQYAGRAALDPLTSIPAFGAPALEYLAESHAARNERSVAS